MKTTLFSACVLVGALAFPTTSNAQNCAVHYAAGFAQISGLVAKATSQLAADQLVDQAFGARPQQCEANAYTSFVDQFELFGRTAIRAGQPPRGSKGVVPAVKENQMRLAISIIRKMSPMKVPLADAKAGVSQFKQMRSNLNAVADDAGNTPMMTQVLEAISQVGSPRAIEETVQVGSSGNTAAAGSATPGTPGGVQQVRVPNTPLPAWAVIKLYEARDLCKPQDVAGIQIRLQDIINWMEANAQPVQ
ncbi:MAG TPA: hypothetical protein PKE31_04485 [Pseudomonadota bacterium]|nr:hypothetical protein [Pseudomonadota bacterium]